MGFVPDADNAMVIRHPKFGPADGHDNSISFANGRTDSNINNVVEEYIIEHVNPEIMEFIKNGPFNGYERYRIKFNDWNVTNEIISVYMSCETLNLPPGEHGVKYNMLTRKYKIEPKDFPNLAALVDKYGKFVQPDSRKDVIQKITSAGFERISEHAYIHAKYPSDNAHNNVLNIKGYGFYADTCCWDMYYDFMLLFVNNATYAAEIVLQDYKKYAIKRSKWALDRGCLVAKLRCIGMHLFNQGEIIYNPFGNTHALYIEGIVYPNLEIYLYASTKRTREIMDMLASQFEQLETRMSSMKERFNLPI